MIMIMDGQFDEKFYEEDEFAEGPDNGSNGDNGGTQNEPSTEGGEPSNSDNTDDFTTEVLKIRGINDPSKIKFEDVTGAVVERSWDELSKEEQLNIIVGDQKAEENEISDDEVALINAILQMLGINTLPIENEELSAIVSGVFLVGMALWNTWKNRNITTVSQEVQQIADAVKNGELLIEDVQALISKIKK